jgi:hypothetical protein
MKRYSALDDVRPVKVVAATTLPSHDGRRESRSLFLHDNHTKTDGEIIIPRANYDARLIAAYYTSCERSLRTKDLELERMVLRY